MLTLFPGMGADSTMYAGPWRSLSGVRYVDWPPYAGERTLGTLAERMIDACRLTPEDEVGGTSLGGMVALEVARRLGQRRVLLLSSANSPRAVPCWLRSAAPLAPIAPFRLACQVIGRTRRASAAMLLRSDPRFLRAMCQAVIRWEGFYQSDVQLVQVHGDRDWVIRCPHDAHVVHGAGHLMVLTHPRECIELVRTNWYVGDR